jgi:hypothetical protein
VAVTFAVETVLDNLNVAGLYWASDEAIAQGKIR